MPNFIINPYLATKITVAAERGATAVQICKHYKIPGEELKRVQTWVAKYGPKPKPKPKPKELAA